VDNKKRLFLISFLLVFVFLIADNRVIQVKADDNYSTYLFNQEIDIDNDKAHIYRESADGSNSYRNLFESNFLFPAKLQNNMFSTQISDTYSHYSFNQFYFDNLDNSYAYASNDNSENEYQSIEANEFDVNKGSQLANGSVAQQDSTFGKYNATYTFDEYQETESNFGNYYGSYSFENDVIGSLPIGFEEFYYGIGNIEVIESFQNHNRVVNITKYTGYTNAYLTKYISTIGFSTIDIEFWFYKDCNTESFQFKFFNSTQYVFRTYFSHTNFVYQASSGSGITLGTDYSANWYHLRYNFNLNNGLMDIFINNNEIGSDITVNCSDLTKMRFETWQPASQEYHCYIDALGISTLDNYTLNDNTNPYGLQTELENDFSLDYDYNSYCYINSTLDYHNNVLTVVDNSDSTNFNFQQTLDNEYYEGITYIQMKTNDTTQYSVFELMGSGIRARFYLGINKFRYYDGSFHDIDNIFPSNNEWYTIKIHFNTYLYWNVSINGILAKVSGNSQFNYYGSSDIPMKWIYFRTENGNYNYKTEIDNIDFSWTNGYYENRISDLIPLQDNSYQMFESEQVLYNDILYPDGINTWNEWSYTGASSKIEAVNDLDNTSDYIFDNQSPAKKQRFTFENIPTYLSDCSFNISVNFYWKEENNNDLFTLYLDIDSGLGYYTIYSAPTDWTIKTYSFNDLTYAQVNNLEIEFNTLLNSGSVKVASIYTNISAYYHKTEIEFEKTIDYVFDNPTLFTFYTKSNSSINENIDFYVWNYDLESYYLMFEISDYSLYSFTFNESAYFRFGTYKIKLFQTFENRSLITNDYLVLNITYSNQEYEGYHKLLHYNYRYSDSDVYLGYTLFELEIHNTSIKYRYSEINEYNDNYIYAWIEYNTTSINLENIELQVHCRYGLNTLDVEIVNYYYQIWLNYDTLLEFREQSRKELNSQKIKSSFNYTSFTNNYLNLTGVIGNYSYSCFNGMRSLYGSTDEIFHRYFNIPFFSDDIDVSIPLGLPEGSASNPNEPDLPSLFYWTYTTFRTVFYQNYPINVGNWSVDYSQMRSEQYTAKYPYEPESISRDDLGSWKWKIKFSDVFSYTVDFNFMRNAIVSILNLILLFIQWVFFMAFAGMSYLFMFIGTQILVFIWNTLLYVLFLSLVYLLWWSFEGLIFVLNAIWQGLVWVWENLLLPFFEWLLNDFFPLAIDVFIIVWAWIITWLLYAMTLGQIDPEETYEAVYNMLRTIADFIWENTIIVINNLPALFIGIGLYLLLIGLTYVKYVYCKARGYKERAETLYSALMVYLLPITIIYDIIKKIYDAIPTA